MSEINGPKKRGRKAKVNSEKSTAPKKRGRKPKGGKIIENSKLAMPQPEIKPNVILHLKCSLSDIQEGDIYTDTNNLQAYTFDSSTKNTELSHLYHRNECTIETTEHPISENTPTPTNVSNDDTNSITNKALFNKIKQLQYNLHHSCISDKKSACFWCTYEFDNPPIYIPKNEVNNNYNVYGCFCSPECATAYLMEESIDISSKFERYHLLNHIYAKIYNYTTNIKPAANPFYTLDKYYGNLSIQEYRKLLSNDRLLFIVDKPMTRILPELHDDNEDYMINKNSSNTFKVKRTKQVSKSSILNENFGMNQ